MRYQVGMPLDISSDPTHPSNTQRVTTHNVSGGGLGFWSKQDFALGERVFICADCPEAGKVWLEASVVYSVLGVNGYLIGVNFVCPAEPDETVKENTVADWETAPEFSSRRRRKYALSTYCGLLVLAGCALALGIGGWVDRSAAGHIGWEGWPFLVKAAGTGLAASLAWLLGRREGAALNEMAAALQRPASPGLDPRALRSGYTREVARMRQAILSARGEPTPGGAPAPQSGAVQATPTGPAQAPVKPPLDTNSLVMSLRWCTTVLEQNLAGLIDEDRQQLLNTLSGECTQLSHLVSDLQQAQCLGESATDWPMEPLCLSTLVRDILRSVTALAEQKGIVLWVDCPDAIPSIHGNYEKITQVVRSMVSNAIMANSPESTVHVSVEVRENEIRLTVADNGPGVPREGWEDVFDPRHCAPAGDGSRQHRSGLGMYVVRRIVEAHGGNVWLNSEIGQGTQFHVVFPLQRQRQATSMVDRDRTRGNVIVCDTDPELAAQIGQELRRAGYDVHIAHSGRRLLAALSQSCPDVVLSDTVLPDMPTAELLSGIQTARASGVKFILHCMEYDQPSTTTPVDIVLRRPAVIEEMIGAVRIAMMKKTQRALLILLVKGWPVESSLLQRALESRGHVCFVVDQIADAAGLLRDYPFDFLILSGSSASPDTSLPSLPEFFRGSEYTIVLDSGSRKADAEIMVAVPDRMLRLPYRSGQEEAVAAAVTAFGHEQMLMSADSVKPVLENEAAI